MNRADAKKAFLNQQARAKTRGIGWELTFQQWLDWWGDDLDRRGSGQFDLQMQRLADTGPYRLDNIRKGTPRQNSATYGRMLRKRNADEAKRNIEAARDADEGKGPSERIHEHLEGDDFWLKYHVGMRAGWLP